MPPGVLIVDFLRDIEEREKQFANGKDETDEEKDEGQPHEALVDAQFPLPASVRVLEAKVEDEHDEKARDTEAEETEQQVEDTE